MGMKYLPDLSRLKHWTPEDDIRLPPPYVARFLCDGKSLSFVGAVHATDINHPQYPLLFAEFSRLRPQLAILEGIKTEDGFSPPNQVERFSNKTHKQLASENVEIGVTASLAIQEGIDFVGAEPSNITIKEQFQQEGEFEIQDLAAFYILRMIPIWKARGQNPSGDFSRLFAEQSVIIAKTFDVEPSTLISEVDFIDWAGSILGGAFDPNSITTDHCAPLPGGRLKSQRINLVVNRIRNGHIINTIAEQLDSHDRIFVPYGHGHYLQLEDILIDLLGEPEIILPR